MNKNVENYKKAVDQIHASDSLKDRVLEQASGKQKAKKPIYYLRYVAGLAAVVIVAVVGVNFVNKTKDETLNVKDNLKIEEKDRLASIDIRRFESVEELKEALKENEVSTRAIYNSTLGVMEDASETVKGEETTATATVQEELSDDYSRTNNQVENVDEADIVKTDGKYIYYSQNARVYIVDTNLNQKASIKEENFRPSQIFVNGNKLIVFGNKNDRGNIVLYNTTKSIDEEVTTEDVSTVYRPKTLVKIYDLSDIENPSLVREISIDGSYREARMIEDNVYLVTQYYAWFYRGIDELKDTDILPCYEDSLTKVVNYVEATDIAYFENTDDYGYSLISGFNLNKNEEVNVETFFGAGDEVYVSEKNMYIVAPNYSSEYWSIKDSTIYKFQLDNAKVSAVAEGKVPGYTRNQFSIDEYEGNLRVATTSYESNYRGIWTEDYEAKYSTYLTILNEKLEKIGGIDNLIEDEEIYGVRFMGKVGYIVTFQEIDPLWVVDLSDPTNPVVKGELEIPGYSSYLHPYDDTHIIGIGYNVKDNGYGGVMNDTIKISMFDVSDLENPKEVFNKTLDNEYVSSAIMYEHKALFFNKSENLIGFPVSWWSRRETKSGLLLYKIDMENQTFEEIDDLIPSVKFPSIDRAIYIGNNIYTIYQDKIIKYDIKTLEKLGELELQYDYGDSFYW
ncbi:MAG: beta-propeller domain-containing protein [Clostridia bacterium]|nr:beta-propeller domain-containing protein [Clostridia bacterium]